MKKLPFRIVSSVLVLLLFNMQAFTNNNTVTSEASALNNDMFSFSEEEVYNSFTDVEDLVLYLNNNVDVSYADLVEANIELLENISNSSVVIVNNANDAPPLMGSFWWGCLPGLIPPLGIAGVIVVMVTTDDSSETWKAIGGCLLSGCLVGGSLRYKGVY